MSILVNKYDVIFINPYVATVNVLRVFVDKPISVRIGGFSAVLTGAWL